MQPLQEKVVLQRIPSPTFTGPFLHVLLHWNGPKPFPHLSILCFFNPGTDSTSSCLCWSYLPPALWGTDHMEVTVLHHREGAFGFVSQLLLDSQGDQWLQLFLHKARAGVPSPHTYWGILGGLSMRVSRTRGFPCGGWPGAGERGCKAGLLAYECAHRGSPPFLPKVPLVLLPEFFPSVLKYQWSYHAGAKRPAQLQGFSLAI